MKHRILILGGTLFAGRLVTEKLKRLPEVELVLFNRGKSNPELFSEVKQIHGQRDSDEMLALAKEHWDVIIDFSGYYPQPFRQWIQRLSGKSTHYIFISTISVFNLEEFEGRAVQEADPIKSCLPEQEISALPDAYGEKKAEMERILEKSGLRHTILRPSYISGRYDWTERFYYWLWRIHQQKPFVYPSETDSRCPITLAEDLANTIVDLCFRPAPQSIYHVISAQKHSMADFVRSTAECLKLPLMWKRMPASSVGESAARIPLVSEFNFDISQECWLRDFNFPKMDYKKDIEGIIAEAETAGWPEPKKAWSYAEEEAFLRTQINS